MNIFSSLMKPKNKFSLDNLKYLYSILLKNPVITPQNSSVMVETLRQIAEVLIWGDQNNPTLFEYFLEKNLLGFFVSILEQKTSSDIIIQLLQTLSILVENLRKELSIYYLLSNNFINEIIIHKYDFSNEEVLDYYISFLKALSLKLDKSTINFFFNGQEKDFPLYTEAIKFINHKETMVRIAVRTLTLNVFKVEDESMRAYIINSTAVPYFSNIVWFIRQECAQLHKILEKSSHGNISQLNYYVEELTDQFYYLHDIFNLGFDSMNLVLAEQFIQYLIFPLLMGSLLDSSNCNKRNSNGNTNPDTLEDRLSPTLSLFLLSQVFHIFTYKPLLDTVASAIASTTPSQSLMLATSVSAPPPLTTLSSQRKHYNSFRRFSSFPNLEQLEQPGSSGSPASPRKKKSLRISTTATPIHPANNSKDKDSSLAVSASTPTSNNNNNSTFSDGEDMAEVESNMSSPSSDLLLSKEMHSRVQKSELSSSIDSGSTNLSGDSNFVEKRAKKYNRNDFKEALIQLVSSDRETFGVVCMLFSFLKNTIIDRKILENGGMLPYRLAKAKKLLEGLLSPETRSPVMSSSMPNIPSHYRSKSESHARVSPILSNSVGKRDLFSEVDDQFSALSNAFKKQQKSQLQSSQSSIDPTPILKIIKPGGFSRDDDEQEFVPVPDSSQTLFTRTLIDRLFLIMVNSNQFRLVTLQMTLLVLKELIYTPESPSKMTETQLSLLEEAYSVVTTNLRECINGNIAPFFLELFEEELRSYKQINFENLVKDVALILPVPETPISRLALSRRLPSGEVEKVQKAIQQFFVLRELKFTLLRRKDNMLPLKQPNIPLVREKDLFNLDTDNYDIIYYYQVTPQQAGHPQAKKKTRHCGVLFHNLLLNVDPNTVSPAQQGTNRSGGIYGTITHIAPLQRLEIEQSHLDPTILRVFSHPTTWNVDMGFDEESKCQQAKQLLESARDDVRSSKMRQIYSLLGERDPDDDDPSSISLSSTPPLRVIGPIDASNSHPLAFSGEEVKPQSTKDKSNTPKNLSISTGNIPNMQSDGKRLSIGKESIFSSFLNDTDDNFLQNYKESNLLSEANNSSDDSSLFSAFKPKSKPQQPEQSPKHLEQEQLAPAINSSADSVNTTNENENQSTPDENLEESNSITEADTEVEAIDNDNNSKEVDIDNNNSHNDNIVCTENESDISQTTDDSNNVDSNIETSDNKNHINEIKDKIENIDLNSEQQKQEQQ